MRAYAVIDTNVLVSSLLSRNADAVTVRVVAKALEGDVVPVYSAEVMEEYREVLSRRFGVPPFFGAMRAGHFGYYCVINLVCGSKSPEDGCVLGVVREEKHLYIS